MLKSNPILTLSVAASLLDVHPRTLMLYEREGLIKPFRTSTNRRLFSQADLAFIQFIRHLTEKEGVNISGVKVILSIIEKSKEKYPELREEFFSEFNEQELI